VDNDLFFFSRTTGSVINGCIVVMLLVSMFPYLKTSPLGSDVQAHVFVVFAGLVALTLVLGGVSWKAYALFFLGLAFFGLTIALHGRGGDYIRVLFLFLMLYVFLFFLPKNKELSFKVVSFSVVVYFLGSIAQLVFGIDVLDDFVSNLRFSDSRGLTSFASEPSFLGLISLVQLLLLEIFPGEKKRFFQLLSFLNIVLCASMTVVFPSVMILLSYMMIYKNMYGKGIVLILLLTVGVFLLKGFYSDLRLFMLIDKVFDSPIDLLSHDLSAVNRITRSFGPLYLAYIDNFGFHYFDSLESDLYRVVVLWGLSSDAEITRLSNVVTYLVYPYGWFGGGVVLFYVLFLIYSSTPFYLKAAVLFFIVANVSVITPYAVLLFSLTLQPSMFKQFKPLGI